MNAANKGSAGWRQKRVPCVHGTFFADRTPDKLVDKQRGRPLLRLKPSRQWPHTEESIWRLLVLLKQARR